MAEMNIERGNQPKEKETHVIKLSAGRKIYVEDKKHGDYRSDWYPVCVTLRHQVEVVLPKYITIKVKGENAKIGFGRITGIKGGSFESEGTFVSVGKNVKVIFEKKQTQIPSFPKITKKEITATKKIDKRKKTKEFPGQSSLDEEFFKKIS